MPRRMLAGWHKIVGLASPSVTQCAEGRPHCGAQNTQPDLSSVVVHLLCFGQAGAGIAFLPPAVKQGAQAGQEMYVPVVLVDGDLLSMSSGQ